MEEDFLLSGLGLGYYILISGRMHRIGNYELEDSRL